MTIRRGGNPRGSRHARPIRYQDDVADRYATPRRADADRGSAGSPRRFDEGWLPRGQAPRRRGGGPLGMLRFLVFALALGAIVVVVSLTALRPVVAGAIVDWASDNPGALGLPFVADMVREDLGADLTEPASSDGSDVEFVVAEGDTAAVIADRLADDGFLRDPRAFVFLATERRLTGQLEAGTFILRRNMTPDQLVTALLEARTLTVTITFREGLRLEQVTAKLQTLPLTMDVAAFYEMAREPPPSLLADYDWLADLPEGASLEGFLAPATYRVLPDITPEALLRKFLDQFEASVGEERMHVPEERGLTFYEVLTLASLVEREARLDEERPLIAGVYQNRLNKKTILNADPTLLYAHDTLELEKLPFEDWQRYVFWAPWGARLAEVEFPDELKGYQSYRVKGLPPSPIATPTVASIDAALAPDTETGYLYFLAIPDGGGRHAFSKTKAEHDANRRRYGYS